MRVWIPTTPSSLPWATSEDSAFPVDRVPGEMLLANSLGGFAHQPLGRSGGFHRRICQQYPRRWCRNGLDTQGHRVRFLEVRTTTGKEHPMTEDRMGLLELLRKGDESPLWERSPGS